MNPKDNPQFTAYALGELSAEEAHDLHEVLAAAPAAAHELEQIEAVTDALRHVAPIPQTRLSHEQRYAVLHPAHLPRRVQPMQPRQAIQRHRPAFWPVMGVALKAAAVVALTGGAFLAGWSFSPVVQDAAQIVATPPKQKAAPQPIPAGSKPALVVAERQVSPVTAQDAKKVGAALPAQVELAPVAAKTSDVRKEIVVVSLPAPAPVVPPVTSLGFAMPAGRGSFASTTKQAADQFSLHPGLLKPAPVKAKGELLASPPTANAKPDPKPARATELYIHSWKAEVAACPWNAAHRLLRIVIQLPASQLAVTGSDAVFPFQITFDVANVKQYRMLSARQLAAASMESAATQIMWYEFQPNGAAADVARDRLVANVTLPNARFTSPLVGPFDSSSKMQVIDRGFTLQNAREDFVFESAVVGFGLLLRGAEQTGGLNHDLVLNLAKQAKGEDVTGERGRFIRLVQDAQRAAGL